MKKNLQLVEKKQQIIEPAEIYLAKIVSCNSVDLNHYSAQLNDGSLVVVTKAESCLLTPQVDDLVMISGDSEHGLFIFQILTRNITTTTNVIDLGVNASIVAKDITFDAVNTVNINSTQLNLAGREATAKFQNTKFVSRFSGIKSERVSLIANTIEKIANIVNDKIVNVFRSVEGVESTKIGSVRSIISGRFFCKAKHLTMSAEEDVAIDGDKINIG